MAAGITPKLSAISAPVSSAISKIESANIFKLFHFIKGRKGVASINPSLVRGCMRFMEFRAASQFARRQGVKKEQVGTCD